MRKLIHACLLAALAATLPGVLRAQNSAIETDANLKDTTTHVVVERKVIETTKTYQQDTPREAQRKIVIIVENRASADLNDKVAVLEDLVASRVAGRGLSVISRDVVTRALKNYSTGKDPNGALGAVDRSLEDQTSALRLAQNLGADYILVPSLISLGSEQRNYAGNGISTLNTMHRLLVSYKLVEANEGGAVRGGALAAEKNIRQTAALQTDDGDVINTLLNDAADQLADAIVEVTETGSSLRANKLKVIDTILESNTQLIANRTSWQDAFKRQKLEDIRLLLDGAINALGKVGLILNVHKDHLTAILGVLPALKRPTISHLSDEDWYAVHTILDESTVRTIIPRLKQAGGQGIVEYPLNKIVL